MAVAACDANRTRTSSSALVNSGPPSFSPRKKLPTWTSRCRIGVHCIVFDTISSVEKPSSRDVGRQIRHPQRLGQVPEVREQPRSVRPRGHHRVHAGREAGGDELLRLPGVVDGGDQAVAGAGQRAGAVDDLAQDGLEVEAGADAQNGRATGSRCGPRVSGSVAATRQDSPARPFLAGRGARGAPRAEAAVTRLQRRGLSHIQRKHHDLPPRHHLPSHDI